MASAPTTASKSTGNGDYESLLSAALARRDSTLPPEFLAKDLPEPLPRNVFKLADSLLNSKELSIVRLGAAEIRDEIASSRLTAEEALRAVAKRAVHAQQMTNCLTDMFFDQALKRAQALDQHYKKTGKLVGPLHGVPMSIKDSVEYVGRPTAASWLCWDGLISEKNAHLVDILEDAGAVIFCKTAMPQSAMMIETRSYLGVVKNPYDLNATPGGSSGGESALIALCGSPLGIGTDIGGSVRVPSAYCSLSTLKPTTLRIPFGGLKAAMTGSEGVYPTAGPMARSLRDVDLFMQVILDSKPHLISPELVPIPWRQGVMRKPKFRIGYFIHDGVVTPHPPVIQAMEDAIARLKQSDMFELVPFEPYKHKEGVDLTHALYFPDGGARLRDLASRSGEPILPLIEWVLSRPRVRATDVHGLWALASERGVFRKEYAAHWQRSGVDAVICPPTATTAPQHETTKYWGYTAIWNLLDYPAVVIPSHIVSESQQPSTSFTPVDETDAKIQAHYNPADEVGHPIGLQVVTYRYEDELAVGIASEILGQLGGQK